MWWLENFYLRINLVRRLKWLLCETAEAPVQCRKKNGGALYQKRKSNIIVVINILVDGEKMIQLRKRYYI